MTALETLQQYFGYGEFRIGQETLIDGILAGRDVLGIMPTGAGKSVCFQIPALMTDGLTLVISPLISLMKDQVNALTQSGVPAAFINSSLTQGQIEKAMQNAVNGDYKLMYIAPERLPTAEIMSLARSVKISMLTVDEAHCISQWGQDFRPSYAQIPDFIAGLPSRPVVSAFTATATPRVQGDIVKLLQLNNPQILVTGFDRQNLRFDVHRVRPRDKYKQLATFLKDRKERSGIIYCGTRKAVEEVCGQLRADGYGASRYHAGLMDVERRDNQDDFLHDRVQIMVATNAFGMGIDKSNVSFVVHYNMPKDIESYYQEAGRAGRDGGAADCVLLYTPQDVRLNEWMIENDKDAQYSDPAAEMMLKERSRKRLRDMTFYSTTSDCLRAFILRYFGETPPNYCGGCSSCNTDFETADITIDAQQILSCVARMNERYGARLIVEVLRGSTSERIASLGLNKLSTFGINKKQAKQLYEIINFLVMRGYLAKTDDEYPIIRLGEHAEGVLRRGVRVEMKLSAEKPAQKISDVKESRQDKKSRKNKGTSKLAPGKSVNKGLFDVLRALRLEIATEQKIPAYIIFADSSLTDMCIKIPRTKDDFLNVAGVGIVKLERYGEIFLKAIEEYLGTNAISQPPSPPAVYDASKIEITDEPATVSAIADRINCVFIEIGRKNITARRINDWLISKGYLEITTADGKDSKTPTAQGTEFGITRETRPIRGQLTELNVYGKGAQEVIVQNALKIQ
ncbi:MAG: DNA helicase RecQ [Chitinispirillales bacterium]|jgi:ATP-dependent DNA helicase RecQ|nr:DNA helicase RecQ [Chitinispirillales bacterium]